MVDVLSILTNPSFMVVAGITVAIIIVIFKIIGRKTEDIFPQKTVVDVLAENLKDKFKLLGNKCNAEITSGLSPMGKIDVWFKHRGIIKNLVRNADNDDYKNEEDSDGIEYNIYFFRIWKTNWLFRKIGIGYRRYLLVDQDLMDKGKDDKSFFSWTLKPEAHFERWGNVFFTSKAGLLYLYDVSIKHLAEDTLTHTQNMSGKIVYLEGQHAKLMERIQKKEKLRREGWEKAKKGMGVDDDAESEE